MNKIFITGTGRSGTTFLMIILTLLGKKTGFGKDFDRHISKNCNSGLEVHSMRGTPYIIKDPSLIDGKLRKINSEVIIDHVYIPIRNYNDSAKSRESHGKQNGGLVGNAKNAQDQLKLYYKWMAEYLKIMVEYEIPTTFIDFDKMINKPEYLFDKLTFVLGDTNYEEFLKAYNQASNHQNRKPK